MEHFGTAWDHVKDHLGSWVVFVLVYTLVVLFTCGLGAALWPNVYRATKKAIATGSGPDVGDIFYFGDLVDYIVVMLILFVGGLIFSFVPVVGGVLLLTFVGFAPMLVADGEFGAVEAIQAAFWASLDDFVNLLVFWLIVTVVEVLSLMCCVLPFFVAGPVCIVAAWLFYDASKSSILAKADEKGLKRKSLA